MDEEKLEEKQEEKKEPYVVKSNQQKKYEYIMKRRAEGAKMKDISAELGMTLQSAYRIMREEEGRATKWDLYKEPKKVGRPRGAKDKKPRKLPGITFPIEETGRLQDPVTGAIVVSKGTNGQIIARMGDERVSAFVQYHLDMFKMRQGADPKNVPDLYNRFYNYLMYCIEHGIIPNNMNAYFAIGVSKEQIRDWYSKKYGTPEQHQFAVDIKQFFASVHEQGGGEGIVHPILSIFWSKAHDGMIEAQKLEVSQQDPLGEKRSAEDIMKRYEGVELPK